MIQFVTNPAARRSTIRFFTSAPVRRSSGRAGAIMEQVRIAAMARFGENLRKADLSNIPLRGADLKNAKLMRADLRGADLTSADLRGVLVDESTILPVAYVIESGRVVRV